MDKGRSYGVRGSARDSRPYHVRAPRYKFRPSTEVVLIDDGDDPVRVLELLSPHEAAAVLERTEEGNGAEIEQNDVNAVTFDVVDVDNERSPSPMDKVATRKVSYASNDQDDNAVTHQPFSHNPDEAPLNVQVSQDRCFEENTFHGNDQETTPHALPLPANYLPFPAFNAGTAGTSQQEDADYTGDSTDSEREMEMMDCQKATEAGQTVCTSNLPLLSSQGPDNGTTHKAPTPIAAHGSFPLAPPKPDELQHEMNTGTGNIETEKFAALEPPPAATELVDTMKGDPDPSGEEMKSLKNQMSPEDKTLLAGELLGLTPVIQEEDSCSDDDLPYHYRLALQKEKVRQEEALQDALATRDFNVRKELLESLHIDPPIVDSPSDSELMSHIGIHTAPVETNTNSDRGSCRVSQQRIEQILLFRLKHDMGPAIPDVDPVDDNVSKLELKLKDLAGKDLDSEFKPEDFSLDRLSAIRRFRSRQRQRYGRLGRDIPSGLQGFVVWAHDKKCNICPCSQRTCLGLDPCERGTESTMESYCSLLENVGSELDWEEPETLDESKGENKVAVLKENSNGLESHPEVELTKDETMEDLPRTNIPEQQELNAMALSNNEQGDGESSSVCKTSVE